MSFEIIYHDDRKFIEVKLLVDFNWQVMSEIVPNVAKLVLDKDCRYILLDFRAGDLDLTTFGMYQTPEKLREEFQKYGVDLLRLKRAYLISKNDRDNHFFETVMKNRGQTFQLFLDREAAIDWLSPRHTIDG